MIKTTKSRNDFIWPLGGVQIHVRESLGKHALERSHTHMQIDQEISVGSFHSQSKQVSTNTACSQRDRNQCGEVSWYHTRPSPGSINKGHSSGDIVDMWATASMSLFATNPSNDATKDLSFSFDVDLGNHR